MSICSLVVNFKIKSVKTCLVAWCWLVVIITVEIISRLQPIKVHFIWYILFVNYYSRKMWPST